MRIEQLRQNASCAVAAAEERVTASTIRPDYRRMPTITPAEAGDLAGVSYRTVQKWFGQEQDGRRLFRRGYQVGPFQVDRISFEEYLRTGRPQGDPVGMEGR